MESKKSTYQNLSPEEFESSILKDKDAVLLDVRTEEEYSSGSIPGAINANIMGYDFLSHMNNISKDKNVYVFCRSGGRSASACMKLIQEGYQKVFNLDGGIMNYVGKIE